MKKILSLILALTLVFAMSVPALAVNSTGGNTEITTSVAETYVLIIPDSTKAITWNTTEPQSLGTIGLSAVRLKPNNQVTITLSGNEGLVNTTDSSKIIAYAIKDGSENFTSANFTTVSSKALTIVVTQEAWNAAPAGDYSDTVTFTASITRILT